MKHYIVVKWNNLVENKKEMFEKAKEAFSEATKIEGVYSCEFFSSCSSRENRYDLMILLEMSEDGLLNYDVSEMHVSWKNNYGQYIEKKAIFDCE